MILITQQCSAFMRPSTLFSSHHPEDARKELRNIWIGSIHQKTSQTQWTKAQRKSHIFSLGKPIKNKIPRDQIISFKGWRKKSHTCISIPPAHNLHTARPNGRWFPAPEPDYKAGTRRTRADSSAAWIQWRSAPSKPRKKVEESKLIFRDSKQASSRKGKEKNRKLPVLRPAARWLGAEKLVERSKFFSCSWWLNAQMMDWQRKENKQGS